MKKLLLAVCLSTAFILSASSKASAQSLSQLKNDYRQVAVVARVKINEVKFAAQDVHPLYVVRGEILEPFKGKIKRGQRLEFYFHAEDDYDVNQLLGERIIFLEGKHPIPPGAKGWYMLENSSLSPSEKNVARMRKIRDAGKRG